MQDQNSYFQKRIRKPTYISWIVTKKCNLNCPHCYVALFSENELELEKKMRLIKEAYDAGLTKLDLTGGEVLVLPDSLTLIDYVCSLGVDLTVFTNGTSLTEKKVKILSQYPLSMVISIDGATKETHEKIRGPGSWEIVTKAMAFLSDNGIQFSTLTAINPYNLREIEEIILLAKMYGAKEACFIPTMPAGRAKKTMVMNHNETVSLLKRICAACEDLSFLVSLWCMPFADIWVNSQYVLIEHCRLLNPEIIDIDPSGNLLLCDVASLKYSNVLEDGIISALEKQSKDPLYISIINPKLKEPCLDCNNKEKCKGGCYARAELYGNILDPDPFCPKVAGIDVPAC